MIHTIGDSHSNWSNLAIQHHIGPMTCYRFGLENECAKFSPFELLEDDIIVFCLGEIDCRCHIHKHGIQTIDGIVDRYFKTIEDFGIPRYIRIAVYNVVPPVRSKFQINNSAFPFNGSDEERREYVLYFNRKLKEYCERYGFWFIDIYDKYCDIDGFLNRNLSDGTVHIHNFTALSEHIYGTQYRG